MLAATLTFTARKPLPPGIGLAELRDHFAQALDRCQAAVTPAGDHELSFAVSLRRPERLGLTTPDLGMVSGGLLELEVDGVHYRVRAHVQVRTWVLLLAIAPWVLALWATGLVSAPWRWLLALGGIPLAVLMWLVVWGNVETFWEHTDRTLRDRAAAQS